MNPLHRAIALVLVLAAPVSLHAQIWEGSSSDEWGDADNWVPTTVPDSSGAFAIFDASTQTAISISTSQGPTTYDVGSISFENSASAYTFDVSTGMAFTIHSAIDNLSSETQEFDAAGGTINVLGASLGSSTLFTTSASGTLAFYDSASAADAQINNDATVEIYDGGDFSLGSLSGSGSLVSYDGSDLTVGNLDTDTTYSGTLSSGDGTSMSVTKTGSGSLTLSGDNSYDGGTTVSEGTLVVGSDTATGTGDITLSGGTLSYSRNVTESNDIILEADSTLEASEGDATQAGAISESGGSYGITKSGNGTLFLTGENTFTGTTTISAGKLWVGDGGTSGSITGDVANEGTLVFDRSDDITYDGVISGSGDLTKEGGGTLTLGSANTFSGTTEIIIGQIIINNENALQNSTVELIADDALAYGDSIGTINLGALSGFGDLSISGTGFLIVGSNDASAIYSGNLTGDFIVGTKGSGTWTLKGTDHDFSQLDPNGSVVFDGAGGTIGSVGGSGGDITFENGTVLSITGIYADAEFTATGSGTQITVDTLRDYTSLLVEDGAVVDASEMGLGESSMIVDGGELLVGDISSSSSSSTIQITDPTDSVALTFNLNDDATLATVIADYTSGSGSITKNGTGTLTLNSANTFTGTTYINDGQILANDKDALQNSTVQLSVDDGLDFGDSIGTDEYAINLGSLSGFGDLSTTSTVYLTAGSNGDSVTYYGSFTGDFVVNSAGTWTLSGTEHDFLSLEPESALTLDAAAGTVGEVDGDGGGC